MTHSLSFRLKVFSFRERHSLTIAEVAARFDIGVASVVRWLKDAEPKLKRDKPAIKIDTQKLAHDVAEYSDSYHHERAERLGVSRRGIGHALKRLGVTYSQITLK